MTFDAFRVLAIAASLLVTPAGVLAADDKTSTVTPPKGATSAGTALQGSPPALAPARPAAPKADGARTGLGAAVTRPGQSAGADRMRQANELRDARQMQQMKDLRQGVQGAQAMPGGGQQRSGASVPGVPGAGQPGSLPGFSASGQDGGDTGGSRRSGGAHTGGGAPYLPGFEPRPTQAGGGARSSSAPRDPFVRDASGQPISQPAGRSMGDDGKKAGDKPVDKPKDDKPKEEKASYEKPADKDTKEKESKQKETYDKEPAGKEPKEKTDKGAVMPRDDAGGGGAPRMTNASQGSGPGARGGVSSDTVRGPRVRASGVDVNPQLDAPRGGFAPRSRDQMNTGPGARPGAYGRGDPD